MALTRHMPNIFMVDRNATALIFRERGPPEQHASLDSGWNGHFILQEQIREVETTLHGLKNKRPLQRTRLEHFHDGILHHRVSPREGCLLPRLPLSVYLLKVVGTKLDLFMLHGFTYQSLTSTLFQNDLENLQSKCDSDTLLFRVDNLTPTVSGLHGVPLVTITSSASLDNSIPMVKRKLVFLTARVHPGETNSSWVMKGLMDYLVSSDITAKDACARIVFKIVPMLNVEGVINGWCELAKDFLVYLGLTHL